jgi:hypothetical protein
MAVQGLTGRPQSRPIRADRCSSTRGRCGETDNRYESRISADRRLQRGARASYQVARRPLSACEADQRRSAQEAGRELAFQSLRNLTVGDADMPLPNNFKLLARLGGSIRELGVYAAIALIVPGGSLIALCVWAFRHRRPGERSASG